MHHFSPPAGGMVGQRLSDHPDIRKLGFTGSTPIGKQIMKRYVCSWRAELCSSSRCLPSNHPPALPLLCSCAVSNLKKVSLELGGKSPLIIFSDCDMDKAVRMVRGCHALLLELFFFYLFLTISSLSFAPSSTMWAHHLFVFWGRQCLICKTCVKKLDCPHHSSLKDVSYLEAWPLMIPFILPFVFSTDIQWFFLLWCKCVLTRSEFHSINILLFKRNFINVIEA